MGRNPACLEANRRRPDSCCFVSKLGVNGERSDLTVLLCMVWKTLEAQKGRRGKNETRDLAFNPPVASPLNSLPCGERSSSVLFPEKKKHIWMHRKHDDKIKAGNCLIWMRRLNSSHQLGGTSELSICRLSRIYF